MNLRILQLTGLLIFLSSHSWAQDVEPYNRMTAETEAIAKQYFDAYTSLDWDTVETLVAENYAFDDPTAEHIFGVTRIEGKANAINYFRTGYASISEISFDQQRAFFSSDYAVFEGTLDWTIDTGDGNEVATKAMPFVVVIKVENGKVIEHQDFADYRPYFNALSMLE